MKKAYTLFTILILLASIIPLTIAQEDRDNVLSEAEIALRERLDRANRAFNDRRGALDRVTIRKATLMKKDVNSLKDKLRRCNSVQDNAVTDQDCPDLKKKAKSYAKNKLISITERTLNTLNKLKERYENSDGEIKEEALREINSAIEDIEAAKESIRSLTAEDSTREEFKEAISVLKQELREAKEVFKKYFSKGNISKQRLENAINKFTRLSEKISNRLDRFEARDSRYDFSDLRALLEDLNTQIDEAQSNFDNDNLEAALTNLREAHRILTKILHDFRANIDKVEPVPIVEPVPVDDTDDETNDDDTDNDETGGGGGARDTDDDLTACPADYTPVCSASRTTYNNLCELNVAGGTLAYEGECDDDE